jgi:hypothetical protein
VLAIDAGGTMTDTFIVDDAGAFVADRDRARRRRLERALPFAEWWAAQRERVLAQDLIEPVKVGYAESMKLSPRWAAEFRGFWNLREDFTFDAPTPTLAAELSARPGKITPQQSAAEFLAASEVERIEPPTLAGRPLEPETLAALYDERLSRREVRDIQSATRTRTGSSSGSRCYSSASTGTTRSCCRSARG